MRRTIRANDFTLAFPGLCYRAKSRTLCFSRQRLEYFLITGSSTMDQAFEPRNDLELKLKSAQEGKIDGEVFMEHLMNAQVFMPVEDKLGIGGFQDSNKIKPLIIKTEEGTDVLVLFTGPDRAKPFVKDFPGYEGGLLGEFKWVLETAGLGHGIALNPGWEVGIDMEPEMVEQLAHLKGDSEEKV